MDRQSEAPGAHWVKLFVESEAVHPIIHNLRGFQMRGGFTIQIEHVEEHVLEAVEGETLFSAKAASFR